MNTRILARCTMLAVLFVALGTVCFAQTCQQSTFPQCGGSCPQPGVVCQPNSATQHCECPGSNPPPCQLAQAPQCGGACPEGQVCQAPAGSTTCECAPTIPCAQSAPPQCGGGCPPGLTCQASPTGTGCGCQGCNTCGVAGFPACPCPGPGPCPPQCNSTAGCNSVTSQTVLPPDQPATVYINLITTCGGAIVKQCHPQFFVQGFLTMEEKCCALAAAIKNDPQCQAAGYCVSINDCQQNRTLKVTDSCPGGVLSMGISNDPNIFSQEGNHPIPDYEEELITPSCSDPDGIPGNGDDIIGQVTLGGTATGTPIAPGEPSHVEVDIRESPTLTAHAEVMTGPGQTAGQIAGALAAQLQAQGVHAAAVGRSIRVKGSTPLLAGPGIGIGIGTSDQGITTDTREGPANLIQAAPIPTLSEWGFILGMALLLGAGAWKILKN